jgi:hypothetical protein
VDILYENELDISSRPLDSYGDGEDTEEGKEEEDGEDECEEIEEEVFELGGQKRRGRGPSTTPRSRTHVCKGMAQVTVDPVTGCDQTDKLYWQRIKDQFFKFMPHVASPVTRSYRSLQG